MDKNVIFLLLTVLCFSCQKQHQIDTKEWQQMYSGSFSSDADSLLEEWQYQAIVQKDSAMLCSVYYMRGRFYQENYILFAAQDCYERAQALAGQFVSSALQIDINRDLAGIYRFNKQYTREEYLLKQAIELSERERDTVSYIQLLQHLGQRKKEQRLFQESSALYQEAAKLACCSSAGDSVYAQICSEQALICLYMQRNDSALYWIRKAIDTHAGNQAFYNELQIGIQHHLCGSDSTEFYFRRLTERFPLYRRADAYRYMAEVESQKNRSERAYALLRQYVFFRDSLDNDLREFIIERMQAMRIYRAKQKEAEEAERLLNIRVLQVYRLGATLLIVLVLVGLFYIYIKRRQARLMLHLAQTERAKVEENLLRREAELRFLKEQENSERLEKARLEQRIDYFRRLNEITIPLLMQHRNKAGALHFSEHDWFTLRQNTDACFDQFTARLKAAFPQLTDDEINFCCLVKMELSLAVLSEIYHIAKGSISRKKMRLKEKIGIQELSFDEWIANF